MVVRRSGANKKHLAAGCAEGQSICAPANETRAGPGDVGDRDRLQFAVRGKSSTCTTAVLPELVRKYVRPAAASPSASPVYGSAVTTVSFTGSINPVCGIDATAVVIDIVRKCVRQQRIVVVQQSCAVRVYIDAPESSWERGIQPIARRAEFKGVTEVISCRTKNIRPNTPLS